MTSEARGDAGLSEMRAYLAESRADADKRESRLVKWMVGVVAVATGIIVAGMTALTLFVPSVGN